MSGTKEKKLNLPQSLLLLLLIIVSVAVCIRLKTGGPMIGLFASWIFIYLFCKIFGISYAKIVAGAYDAEMESAVRFSFSEFTTLEQIDYTLDTLREVLPMLRRFTRK